MITRNKVILVDNAGNEIGTEEKIAAHREGKLHRAFSIFIFHRGKEGLELLLQQRHPNKYHSGGLWTNTCCSHPQPGEKTIAAGERRLYEEIGIKTKLESIGEFQYKASLDNQLIEHEYDYVLIGFVKTKTIDTDENEIIHTRWISLPELEKELAEKPQLYTAWLKPAFDIVKRDTRFNPDISYRTRNVKWP